LNRRRVLNSRHIKPNQTDSDEISGKNIHQTKYTEGETFSRMRLMSELAFLLTIIIVPISVQAGFFDKLFSAEEVSETKLTLDSNLAADLPLLTAQQNPNPLNGRGGAEILVEENALVSTGPVGEDEIAEMKSSLGEIKVHTVRPCDEEYCETISHIADMYGVTTNTILWANDITDATSIQSGDTLIILPIVGVQHEVKTGDTISTIAKKYEGDTEEILAYNQLASASEISVGDILIIPGGSLHSATVKSETKAQPTRVSGSVALGGGGFTHPAPGAIRTQGIHGYNAVDLAGGHGSAIRSAGAGEVIVAKSSGWNGGYGQYIVVKHSNGSQTLYAHLSSISVGVGAYVNQGQVIGAMGNTGKSTGTHLHFEVRGATNPF
jgi:Peptidase family M23/LysM domain